MSNVSMIDGHIDETRMTDEDIIKALEKCVQNAVCGFTCKNCTIEENECMNVLLKSILDLINRLKSEKGALINGQITLQECLAEKNTEIEKLKKFDECNFNNKAFWEDTH